MGVKQLTGTGDGYIFTQLSGKQMAGRVTGRTEENVAGERQATVHTSDATLLAKAPFTHAEFNAGLSMV